MTAQRERQAPERWLVTGAQGCIGAWVVRQLLDEDGHVVALDLSDDARRLRLLLSDAEVSRLRCARVDIADLQALEATLDEHAITHVIHLAALQVPFCRADPPLGAVVNVVGTVNVLEAVARRRERMAPVVYASSIAAYGAVDGSSGAGPSPDGGVPGTLYGVYKRANEGAAALFWRDRGLASVGLRPHTVYGLGRDQGLTSAPTSAMLAAAAGVPYHIPYGGRLQLQYAPDVARAFIGAARAAPNGATMHNLAGHAVHMSAVVAAIAASAPESAGTVSYDDVPLPFPETVDSHSLTGLLPGAADTALEVGVAETVERFRELIDAGMLAPPDSPAPSTEAALDVDRARQA